MGNEPTSGGQGNEPNIFRPDTVITPSRVADPAPTPASPAVPVEGSPTNNIISTQPEQSVVAQQSQIAAMPETQPVPAPFQAQAADVQEDSHSDPGAITWTASEFISHEKGANWYVLLGLAAILIAALTWLFSRDIFATAAVVMGVLLLGVYAGRTPKQETFTLDHNGLSIGQRYYPYSDFHSFAAVPEGAFTSVEFTPLKRLAIDTTIYIDPAKEDQIFELLSQHLPMEEAKVNFADTLMRRIHF